MNSSNFWPAPPKKKTNYTNDSIVESLRTIGSGLGRTVTQDVLGKGGSDALQSIFGTLPKAGEMRPNQEVPLRPKRYERPMRAPYRPEIDIKKLSDVDSIQVKQQLDAVRMELKALSSAIKIFNQDIQKAVNEIPVNPGVYHVNFMERLRSVLKILREQIEDSRSWLALSTGRKKKQQYWGKYKKHGTQFGLSSERTLATQAG